LGLNTISDVASIMLHAGRPELVECEIVDLLGSVGCVQYAAAVTRAADGTTTTLAQAGTPLDPATGAGERRLAVGTAQNRQVDVLAIPHADIESAATVNAVVMLIATLHELERARVEREERATLWPLDELLDDDKDAVITGHMRETMALAKKIANTNVSVL